MFFLTTKLRERMYHAMSMESYRKGEASAIAAPFLAADAGIAISLLGALFLKIEIPVTSTNVEIATTFLAAIVIYSQYYVFIPFAYLLRRKVQREWDMESSFKSRLSTACFYF